MSRSILHCPLCLHSLSRCKCPQSKASVPAHGSVVGKEIGELLLDAGKRIVALESELKAAKAAAGMYRACIRFMITTDAEDDLIRRADELLNIQGEAQPPAKNL